MSGHQSRRNFNAGEFDDAELKQILELSKKSFEEETLKRNQKCTRSFNDAGVKNDGRKSPPPSPARKSPSIGGRKSPPVGRNKFMNEGDDDLINFKCADVAKEEKIRRVKELMMSHSSSSYAAANIPSFNQLYLAKSTPFSTFSTNSSPSPTNVSSLSSSYSVPRSFSAYEFSKYEEKNDVSIGNLSTDSNIWRPFPFSSSTSSYAFSSTPIVVRRNIAAERQQPPKINLSIPYLSINGANLINLTEPSSVDVRVSTREELMKEFDPLMARAPQQHEKSSGKLDEIHEKPSDPPVENLSVPDDPVVHRRSMVADYSKPQRPLTIVNQHGHIQKRAFEASKRSKTQGSLWTSTTGFNCADHLRLIDRKSDVDRQLESIAEYLRSISVNADVWTEVIVSARVKYPSPSVTSVKLVVRSELVSTTLPVMFTCDVCSSIEQLTAQVFFDSSPKNETELNQCALKVFALDEYLLPCSKLCDYAYVHNCVKLGKDVELELVKLPSFQENVKYTFDSIDTGIPVKQVDIEIALQTLKREMDKLEETAASGNAAHSNGVVQNIKLICIWLHNIQTLDLIQSLDKLCQICDALVNERRVRLDMQRHSGKSVDGANVFRPSSEMLQNVKRCLSLVGCSVHRLLSTFAASSLVRFTVPSYDDPIISEKIVKEIVDIEECLIVRVESVHNFPAVWLSTYEKFYFACYVFHGLSEISNMIKTEAATSGKSFFDYLKFDSWVTFDKTLLCVLPREARLCFVLFGTKVELVSESSTTAAGSVGTAQMPIRSVVDVQLCWGALPLFDFECRLAQGSFFVSMSIEPNIEPWGPKSVLSSCNKNSPVLSIVLPTFGFDYCFPQVAVAGDRTSGSFDSLDSEQQQLLEDIIEHGSVLDADEKDLLWEKRRYLIKKPEALPLVLKSAVSWDWACLSNVYQIVKLWTPLNTAQAIELLLPEFPDVQVRKKAVSWLAVGGSDQIFEYLPQLVEALSFEVYDDSALIRLLLEFSVTNRRLAFGLFWLLEERRARNLYGCRCSMLQHFLVHILGPSFADAVELQQNLLIELDSVAVNVKHCRDVDRNKTVSSHMMQLDGKLLQRHVHLPINPSVVAVGVDWSKCKFFNSLTLPIKVSFRTLNSHYDVLHKVGDDLRQDALVLQMVSLMDDVWLRHGLDLRMVTYRCLSTGSKKGVIELVSDCKTLREIHAEEGGVTGALKDDSIRKWLQKQNASELDYLSALENFRRSCAGWCVGTFILGIGDRHNDNIMITTRGHVFHIDFGKYLGDAQMFGSFKRDRTPFVLTNDMVSVINSGESTSTLDFQHFVDNCTTAFNAVRNNHALFVNLMKLMVCSNIPGLNIEAVKFISQNLWLDCSDKEASERFTRMIEATIKNKFPKFNFFIHQMAQQMKGSLSNEERATPTFSFTSRVYSASSDGRLEAVNIQHCEKWRENERKVYMYKISVKRVGVKVPSFIYRSYKEFSEFSEFLDQKFPLAKICTLPKGGSLGRTNVRDIAERRKQGIDVFLQSLFRMNEEISHSDIVYTFFHPLLRDEQCTGRQLEDQHKSLLKSKSYEIKGELKLSVEYTKEHLEVMIHHARDLASVAGGAPPDTYVKCYIRPDRERRSKRKTRIIPRAVNPTYNESFVYRWPRELLMDKTLEVTVWRKGVLQENAFLGCVRLPLVEIVDQFTNQKVFESWFPLRNKIS